MEYVMLQMIGLNLIYLSDRRQLVSINNSILTMDHYYS